MAEKKNRRALDRTRSYDGMLSTGTHFEGKLEGKGNYVIKGEFVGDCQLDGVLLVDEGGEWQGNISAKVVVVNGKVRGSIVATEQIEIGEPGTVVGDLQCQNIAIASGASHEGGISMSPAGVTHFNEKRGHP
jgi:cytoskeletal protein CcmA (bactofilin family)